VTDLLTCGQPTSVGHCCWRRANPQVLSQCILGASAASYAEVTRLDRCCAFALQTFAFYLRARLAPYGQYSITKDWPTTVLVDLAFVFGWKRLKQVGTGLPAGLDPLV
jgi:hypothetical protein